MTAPNRRWSFSLRTLLVVVTVLAVICSLLAWGWGRYVTNVFVASPFRMEKEFVSMPVSDNELASWIAAQPGVLAATVHVERTSHQRIVVEFVLARNRMGQPQPPDISGKCKSLGYVGDQ